MSVYLLLGIKANSDGTLRLVGGSTYRSGRVEVFTSSGNNSGWSKICSHSEWDEVDAIVACKQLGFGNNATAISKNDSSNTNNASVLFNNLKCNGNESKLIHCDHDEMEHHHCEESAGLTCGGSFPS